ncbi:uncharacterized protein BCR38DRAFT_117366 [Pseudomassariella vexata]|uniref:Uncharacterized protein n=1 Tax=Pseudomassariella vexata TaxID=1141098 RepID=A0A1Y2DAM0_9PEZI|nr:uncharacterized protein BCR38DRAFT_117366 [Pseudomassariella vexata]ORY56320.1 hypothetical protein BCR38DRAFT_117366 [Pseudomassariella vexata]
MDPSNPSQPPKSAAYVIEGNAVTSTNTEHEAAQHHSHGNAVDERVPPKQSSSPEDATASSLARGIHGAPPGEEQHGRTEAQSMTRELDGEQMRAPGEGDVAGAVERKSGASGSQPDLAGGLERKPNRRRRGRLSRMPGSMV